MLLKTQDYPIGLDISDFSIKVVQLSKKKDKIELQSFGKIFLDKNIIENNLIKDMNAFVVKLKELLDNPKFGKISSKKVVICLPESKTFIKLITITGDQKLNEESIQDEIKKYVPIPVEDTYYDWQVISKNKESKTVLVGVCPKVFVDQYIEALEKAKLSLIAAEIESVAISRALLKNDNTEESQKNYGILDIGANRSSMFVSSPILFNTSIAFSAVISCTALSA